jgi:hypothetical protein
MGKHALIVVLAIAPIKRAVRAAAVSETAGARSAVFARVVVRRLRVDRLLPKLPKYPMPNSHAVSIMQLMCLRRQLSLAVRDQFPRILPISNCFKRGYQR